MPLTNIELYVLAVCLPLAITACADDTTVTPSEVNTTSGAIEPSSSDEGVVDETGSSSSEEEGSSTTGEPTRCGNDLLDDNEECDEGERNGDDNNCMANCRINPTQRLVLDSDSFANASDAIRTAQHAFIGQGSWCNAPGEDLNGNGADKFEVYWAPEEQVPNREGDDDPYFYNWGPTRLSDIADVQYHTFRAEDPDENDFYMLIYTRPDGNDDTGSFYGYRLTGAPWLAQHLANDAGDWITFRLDAPQGDELNTLTFYDNAFTESFPNQPTMADLLDDPNFDWLMWSPNVGTSSDIDYGSEAVEFLSLQTSTGWDTFVGCTDGLTIWHRDGRQLIIDLE